MSAYLRIGFVAAALPILATSIVSLGLASPAHASDCSGAVLCGDVGGGSSPAPTPPGPKPPGSGGGGGGGGGSTTPVDPYAWTVRSTAWTELCPVRNDGKKAKGTAYHYTKVFDYSSDENTPPDSKYNWTLRGSFPGKGWAWERNINTGKTCLYPSRTYFKTVKCSIRYFVAVDKTAPDRKRLAEANKGTGYTENSKNYSACVNSAGRAQTQVPVDEYGFYSVKTWQRAQNARVEVAYTKDEWDGSMAAPKIVSLSPAYNTSPKQGMTGSLDCKNGWSSPGIMAKDYWTDENCVGNAVSSYVCSAPMVRVDASDVGKARMLRNVSGDIQLMRDGKPRLVWFQQDARGNSITIQRYKNHFERTGTPWDFKLPVNKNLVELRSSSTSGGILKTATETGVKQGKGGQVWVSGYHASNPGGKTQLTHHLVWEGTKKVQSVSITEINPNDGTIITTPRTVIVPTSGSCSQSVGLQYIRSIGDAQ